MEPNDSSPPDTQALLRATKLLDHDDPSIARLIESRGWRSLPQLARVGAAYEFVRNDIQFGYNARDEIPASRVLADGYGQCNTKSTLFMALLRALQVPCRLHGFTIDKRLQRGAIPGWAYPLTPSRILHSWVEAWVDGRWIELEGFILDQPYLSAVQKRFAAHRGPFLGFGVGTHDLSAPPVAWNGGDTYIQRDGINQDFGSFDDPDSFYAKHGANLSGVRRWVFENVVRHDMNGRVAGIRNSSPLDVGS